MSDNDKRETDQAQTIEITSYSAPSSTTLPDYTYTASGVSLKHEGVKFDYELGQDPPIAREVSVTRDEQRGERAEWSVEKPHVWQCAHPDFVPIADDVLRSINSFEREKQERVEQTLEPRQYPVNPESLDRRVGEFKERQTAKDQQPEPERPALDERLLGLQKAYDKSRDREQEAPDRGDRERGDDEPGR